VVELVTVNVAKSCLSGDCAQEEAIIEAAAFHVEQAKVMRKLAQKRAQEAKDDIENGALHQEKWYCLVCDYAQNVGIPHFGKYQPGDTYYYSPLTINLFGFVDLS
jgi:rubrerythrin